MGKKNVENAEVFYIYRISNSANSKLYFGQTVDWEVRKQSHWAAARRGKDGLLYRAMRCHGLDKFWFEVIDTAETLESVNEKEIALIAKYDTTNPEKGYNLALGGGGTRGVVNPSEETREKIGKNNPKFRKDITAEEVSLLWEGGKSIAEITRQLGVSISCVRKRLKYAGVKVPNRRRDRAEKLREEGREDLIEITLDKIKDLYYGQLLSATEMGRLMRVTGETVLSYLRAADLPIRQEGVYKRKPLDGTQVCTVCKKAKALEEFGVHHGLSNGRHFRCRECQREYERTHDKRRKKVTASEFLSLSCLENAEIPGLAASAPESNPSLTSGDISSGSETEEVVARAAP